MDTTSSLDDPKPRNLILVRCGFNGNAHLKNHYPDLNESGIFPKYLKKDISKTLSKPRRLSTNSTRKSLDEPEKSKQNVMSSSDNFLTNNHLSKQNNGLSSLEDRTYYEYESPTSPESRKKELCSYLQLMNPADKKEIFVLQNRRSTRVRNLAAMQEKKQQNKKLSDEFDVRVHEEQHKKPSSQQSMKELNVRVEKYPIENNEMPENATKSLRFPNPPDDLVQTISNFDDIMSIIGPKWKKVPAEIEKSAESSCHCPVESKILNGSMTNKENVEEVKPNTGKVKTNTILKQKYRSKEGSNSINKKSKSSTIRKKQKIKLQHLRRRSSKLRNLKRVQYNESLIRISSRREKSLKIWTISKKKELQQKTDKRIKSQERKSISSDLSEKSTSSKSVGSQCEIVTIAGAEDDAIDFHNFLEDSIDFENLTEEHRRCLIESRIFSSKPITNNCLSNSPSQNAKEPEICQSSPNKITEEEDVSDKSISQTDKKDKNVPRHEGKEKTSSDNKGEPEDSSNCEIIEIEDDPVEDICISVSDSLNSEQKFGIQLLEHDYAGVPNVERICRESEEITSTSSSPENSNCIKFDIINITKNNQYKVLPYDNTMEVKSLHRSLQFNKKKVNNVESSLTQDWDPDGSPKQKTKKQTHYISINKDKGSVMNAFYVDYNLIISQEFAISFWLQTPLGKYILFV